MKTYKKKIFCIEGDWNEDLKDKTSIIGVLNFLSSVKRLEYIYKTCSTKVEFINRIQQFKKYSSYKILYLAFHGSTKNIHIGNDIITIFEIQEILKNSLKDKIIYFGSCKTLNMKDSELGIFMEETGCECIVGFNKNVDFIEGTTIDLLFFNLAQCYKDVEAFKNKFTTNYKEISTKFGFKFFTKKQCQ